MSNPPERPWTEDEKNALLTEILKRDGIQSKHLFRLIRDHNITPKWTEIPLPPGRSLSACQMAFNHMHQSHAADQRPLQTFRPDSSSSAHLPYPTQPQPRKRAIQPLVEPLPRSTPSTPRAIQPRPPTSGGGPFNGGGGVDGSTHVQISPDLDTSMAEPPRKRGRPSKLETQRRMAAAQARGEEYPPPKRKAGPKAKNRQVESSPMNTMGEGGGDSRRDQFSATTSRLQNAIEMGAPPTPATHHEDPSSSNRRRREHTDQPVDHQPAEQQNLRQDPTVGSSPRTRLGGSAFPPPGQGVGGGARVMGQDESGSGSGSGGAPLSTPRTMLASQMPSQPVQPSYTPSFRGINEMGAPPTSNTQGMGSGSPHGMGQSPTVTMAGESNSAGSGGGQKFQMLPGQGGGGGSSGSGKMP